MSNSRNCCTYTDSIDVYRGKSFHYAGDWTIGQVYSNDEYQVDFVTYDGKLWACYRSHQAEPTYVPSRHSDCWRLAVDAVQGNPGDVYIPTLATDGESIVFEKASYNDLPDKLVFDIRGAKGDKGDKGDRGEKGDAGAKGERGDKGEKGDRGDRGAQGEQGIQGPQGLPGRDGRDGEKGDPGERGPQGEKGDRGDKGEKGEQGVEGPRGYIGPQGERGDKGEKGEKGDRGEKGDTGERGEKGDRGDKGEQGLKGEKGDKGDKGEKGDTGVVEDPIDFLLRAYKATAGKRVEDSRNPGSFINKHLSDEEFIQAFGNLSPITGFEIREAESFEALGKATADKVGYLYLVPSEEGNASDLFDEWVVISSGETAAGEESYKWEKWGSASVNLENYYTKDEVNGYIQETVEKIQEEIDNFDGGSVNTSGWI